MCNGFEESIADMNMYMYKSILSILSPKMIVFVCKEGQAMFFPPIYISLRQYFLLSFSRKAFNYKIEWAYGSVKISDG